MTEAKAETATKQGRSQEQGDVWSTAPDPKDTPLFPFLKNEDRSELVNTRAVLQVTGMDYDASGTFGARFVATFIAPDGNAYKYGFKTAHPAGSSPRDKTNKWIWEQINQKKVSPIPVVLCKRGNAYYFDKPGSESEWDTSGGMPGSATESDVPDF